VGDVTPAAPLSGDIKLLLDSFSPGVPALASASFRFIPVKRSLTVAAREEEEGGAAVTGAGTETDCKEGSDNGFFPSSATSIIGEISTVSVEAVASVTIGADTAVSSCIDGSTDCEEEVDDNSLIANG